MLVDYTDYLEAGHHIFPLHPILAGGVCGCGDPECAAAGKHPTISNWQHVTVWDKEQLAILEDDLGIVGRNQLLDGFGVNLLTRGLLVVDIDARNGGVTSAAKLSQVLGLPITERAGFVVETGSGGGSAHCYYSLPADMLGQGLQAHLTEYPGIDFKSTGYVVGCGSVHRSGGRYFSKRGSPATITEAPQALLEMLKRPDRLRSVFEGRAVDYTTEQLAEIVGAIANTGRDYERWIRIGMGIHQATGGSSEGYELWLSWSEKSDAHDPDLMPMKWHSFGKSPSPVTIGTLLTWAKADGYSEPVSFVDATDWGALPAETTTAGMDLMHPPGLVGEIAAWINRRSLYPREHLAVAAALQIVSNAAGLRFRVKGMNTALNLITIGVAGSGTGKGMILECLSECQRAAGLSSATYGGIKSEQEIVRNAADHQALFYSIDEVGSLLAKLGNAKRSGGKSAYLEGIPAAIMAIYSAVNSAYEVTGDMKKEMKERIDKDAAKASKRIDEGDESAEAMQQLADLQDARRAVNSGIVKPYLSLFGVTEPGSFNDAVNGDRWLLTGGFLGRALIFEELETVPRRKPLKEISQEPLPRSIAMRLAALYGGGNAGADFERVQARGETAMITITEAAQEELERVQEMWHGRACDERDSGSGLEALAMRAPELTIKVAGTLAADSTVISIEHVLWASALVARVTNLKISKAKAVDGSESKDSAERGSGLLEAVRSVLAHGGEWSLGVIVHRFRGKFTKAQIQEGIDHLIGTGELARIAIKDSRNREQIKYKIIEK